jgi:hypothetical protein
MDASPNPARGAQPGRYQRPRPTLAFVKRVQMDPDPDGPTLFWDADGELYEDRELTRPTD